MTLDQYITQALADHLVAVYKGKRLTQASLVTATGINATTMQRIMAGKSVIDTVQLERLATALNVSAASLLQVAEENATATMSEDAAKNVLKFPKRPQDMTAEELDATDERSAAAKFDERAVTPDAED